MDVLKRKYVYPRGLKNNIYTFKINNAINKPRHVTLWMVMDETKDNQEKNCFIPDTNLIGTQHLSECYLILNDSHYYPKEF